MNEADAYKIAADVLRPFENCIDVSTGQILANRIMFALFKAYKEGRNITPDAADNEGGGISVGQTLRDMGKM